MSAAAGYSGHMSEGQTTADLSGQNLGPIDYKIIAAEFGFRGLIAVVEELTVDSTCNMRDRRTYTLTTGAEKIDLSQKNLGSADAILLTAWLQRPEVNAAVVSLCCANNPGMVGELDGRGRLKTPDVHANVFKQLADNLKMSNVTEADFSSCGIGPVALGHVSEWVREATVAVSSLAISKNFIFGTKVENAGRVHPETTVHDVDKDQSGWNNLCEQLKGSNITSFTGSDIGMGPVALRTLATSLPAAVGRLVLNDNMITSSSQDRRRNWTYDLDLSGLISLCDALPVLRNPIVLGLAHCGLSTDSVNLLLVHVAEAIGIGAIDGIDLSGCRVEPTMSAQVLSAASDVSRRRLRTAQVLSFSFALHERLGAATAVCELVDKGAVDILRLVSSIVHSRQGHEALCSALARRRPWYKVVVRGLISEGVPHQ